MKTKYLGRTLLILGIILLLTTLIFQNIKYEDQYVADLLTVEDTMERGVSEPVKETNYLIFIIIGLSIGMIVSGSLVVYLEELMLESKPVLIKKLNEEEKKIYGLLNEKKSIYQSRLVKETGWSKVKMSRIIKSLEKKQLIGKEQKGMTNKIYLK